MTDLSHDAPDDGFHEIQLSGKQLVFLFMATTVVSVVIFLCGVLVGRGVSRRAPRRRGRAAPPIATARPERFGSPPAPRPPIVDGAAPADKDLSYTDAARRGQAGRREAQRAVGRAPREAAPSAQPTQPPAADPAAAQATGSTAAGSRSLPCGAARPKAGVWAVQVVALTDRAAASAVVQRLSSKGYPAFLVRPQSGAAVQNYKVQVGKFKDRSEAESVAGRLKKEEQFQPWILR